MYLAGPEVFLPEAADVGAAKRRICARHGLSGLFPIDESRPQRDAATIHRANLALMRQAGAVVANLSPFRGPGADPGTAFEVGFMAALGKPVFAYTNRPGTLLDRMRAGGAATADADGGWRDADGLAIEDFGLAENLMLAVAADIVGADRPLPLGDLTVFEECVRRAAERLC
ncbi:MAG: nucleoside 2-deoxyribosyltransferase [Alphaproteobacteria bacterium]|nr:nucleoside 2-deoxyribosyltransferase [Alphaproteobacteria bacterium]